MDVPFKRRKQVRVFKVTARGGGVVRMLDRCGYVFGGLCSVGVGFLLLLDANLLGLASIFCGWVTLRIYVPAITSDKWYVTYCYPDTRFAPWAKEDTAVNTNVN